MSNNITTIKNGGLDTFFGGCYDVSVRHFGQTFRKNPQA